MELLNTDQERLFCPYCRRRLRRLPHDGNVLFCRVDGVVEATAALADSPVAKQ
jgi:hypothetical protein